MTEPILDPDAPFDIFLAPPAQIHINDHDPIYDPCRSYVDEELRQRYPEPVRWPTKTEYDSLESKQLLTERTVNLGPSPAGTIIIFNDDIMPVVPAFVKPYAMVVHKDKTGHWLVPLVDRVSSLHPGEWASEFLPETVMVAQCWNPIFLPSRLRFGRQMLNYRVPRLEVEIVQALMPLEQCAARSSGCLTLEPVSYYLTTCLRFWNFYRQHL